MATIPDPSFCACCEPRTPPAPLPIYNRPGLRDIAWRSGSYATFRQAMVEAMATGVPRTDNPDDTLWPLQVRTALSALTTRDDADYAILALDLFAAIADVLGFYSERYVNELYLRTARERDSLLRLVRLIGYRFAPGLAATTTLAFTLDTGGAAKIRSGLKVMSVPGPDEVAQVYETIAPLAADARLNALPLFGAPAALSPFAAGRSRLPVTLLPDPLVRGATLVLTGSNQLQLVEVRSVDLEADGPWLSLAQPVAVPGGGTVGFKLKRSLRFFGHAVAASYSFYDANPATQPAKRWVTRSVPADYKLGIAAGLAEYPLDSRIDDLKPGALLLVDRGDGPGRYVFARVTATRVDAAVLGPLADTVTWIALQPVAVSSINDVLGVLPGTGLPAITDRRQTRIFELAQPQVLPRRYAYPPALSGGSAVIRSDHLNDFTLLAKKQRIVIADGSVQQAAVIGSVTPLAAGSDGIAHVLIGFSPPIGSPMTHPLMNGNVAPASHGETQPEEPLGNGNTSALFQHFSLRRAPLTRLPSGTGIAPSPEIAIRINGELWSAAASLFGHGPTERVFTLRDNDDGKTEVGFGDGRTGARLPSGAGNVVARYRTGAGLAGQMRAGQLTTLLERPVGVRAVTNALPSDGGADPETLATARSAAPATVRTFGRAIALQDFEDVARQTGIAFAARASWEWIGLEQAVQLTVAGAGGARLSAAAMAQLFAALGTARDPNHLLILGNLWRVPVVVSARLLRDPAFDGDAVAAAAAAAMIDFFAFETQPMGRALHLSQLVAVLQGAAGVIAVDVDRFQIKGYTGWSAAQLARRGATAAPLQEHIRLFDARPRPPLSALDPLALAGLALDPDAVALPAEQAFLEAPGTDLALSIVEAL